MEKKQADLCQEVFKKFNSAGVLRDVILIGSWCVPFYKKYYLKESLVSPLRTMDIDFFVPNPLVIKSSVNVPDILKDLGFVSDFVTEQGYLRLVHPDLIIEFLVQEKGRGSNKPYLLSKLGLNAQSLRFLNLLSENIIKVNVDGILISIPHPAWFAVHKLIVSQRRLKEEKANKDLRVAIVLLQDLISMGDAHLIYKAYVSVSVKWQNKIIKLLEDKHEKKILEVMKKGCK